MEENRKDNSDVQENGAAQGKPGKRQVTVINAPKRKKKPLKTPSQIIRFVMIFCFVICILLMTYPFISVELCINENLEVSPITADVPLHLATQDEINAAEKRLQTAMDGLVEAPKEEETSGEETGSENSQENSNASQPEGSEESKPEHTANRTIGTAYYDWTYQVLEGVNIDALGTLIDKAMNVDREEYTEESVAVLNDAVLHAQRVLCAKVTVTQNAWQMMVGGPVKEAFGVVSSVGETIFRTILAFALGLIPLVCFFAASFDRRRHIKHVIIMIGCVLALLDLFLAIYPYVGIGAVLSIIMYVIISLLNFCSIYAKQQEDHIVNHPEEEAEFTVKHPQFVKALLNEKSFGRYYDTQHRREQEYKAAKNAQKRNSKKKKGK